MFPSNFHSGIWFFFSRIRYNWFANQFIFYLLFFLIFLLHKIQFGVFYFKIYGDWIRFASNNTTINWIKTNNAIGFLGEWISAPHNGIQFELCVQPGGGCSYYCCYIIYYTCMHLKQLLQRISWWWWNLFKNRALIHSFFYSLHWSNRNFYAHKFVLVGRRKEREKIVTRAIMHRLNGIHGLKKCNFISIILILFLFCSKFRKPKLQLMSNIVPGFYRIIKSYQQLM